MPKRRSPLLTCALAAVTALCLPFASCTKEPSHLGERAMADVMYDLHLAQAIASGRGDSAAYYERMLCDAVLRKHGLTQEELDRNLRYFTSRPEDFYKVYERLSRRIDRGGGGTPLMPSIYNAGDTLNIPPDMPRLLLVNRGRNRATIHFDADSVIKPGDDLELIFRASNIYPEGERNMQAFVRMEYEDSVATQSLFIGGVGYQQETLPMSTTRHLKRISVTFIQNTSWSEKVKLLMLDNIHILRLRHKDSGQQTADNVQPTADDGSSSDTLASHTRDSLIISNKP